MRITSLFSLLSLTTLSLSGALFYVSQEEPIAPHFSARDFNKKACTLSFGVTKTEGHNSYNGNGTPVPFLEQYGTPQIAQFYKGLTPRSNSASERYFSLTGTESLTNPTDAESDYIPVVASLRFDDPQNYYALQSYHLAYTHYLFSGLFFRFNLQLVDQTIVQRPRAVDADSNNARVLSFIDHFDQVLGENNNPSVSFYNRKLEIERAGYFLGWHGKASLLDNFIREISGTLLAGYTFKPTHFDQPLAPAFLPHAQTHGYSAELDLAAQVSNHFGLECEIATTSYGRYTDTAHVVCDDTNTTTYFSGPPLLGIGKVLKDPGTLWVMEAGASLNRYWGFSITGGYHFSYQEATVLTLQDTTILQHSGLSALPGHQNTRLNSDPRLARWKHHTVFVRFGYTPSDSHRFVPEIDFGIHWPVMGQHSSSPTRIYTGSGQLSIRWTF